jgi:hypothetical protein
MRDIPKQFPTDTLEYNHCFPHMPSIRSHGISHCPFSRPFDTLEFSGGKGPCSMLRWKSRRNPAAKIRKVLFVKKRKERPYEWTCSGTH